MLNGAFDVEKLPLLCMRWQEERNNLHQCAPKTILAVFLWTLFQVAFDIGANFIAVLTIQTHLDVKFAYVHWLVSANILMFGCFFLLGHKATRLYGFKPSILSGSLLQILMTIACGCAPSFITLVIFRAFQGLGAALCAASAWSYIYKIHKREWERSNILRSVAITTCLGLAVGNVIGGILISNLDWRYVFWIEIIFAGLALILNILIIPRQPLPPWFSHKKSSSLSTLDKSLPSITFAKRIRHIISYFDIVGLVPLLAGLFMFSYALTTANEAQWRSALVISFLVASIIFLTMFTTREYTAVEPLLSSKLFKNAQYCLLLFTGAVSCGIWQAAAYFLSIQLQSFGHNATYTSVLLLPLGVTLVFLTIGTGKFLSCTGVSIMMILSAVSTLTSLVLLSFNHNNVSYWAFTFPAMLLLACGISGTFETSTTHMQSLFDARHKEDAIATFISISLVLGSMIGTVAMTTVAQGINHLSAHQEPTDAPLKPIAYRAVYYSCMIICGIALFLSAAFLRTPHELQTRRPQHNDGTFYAPLPRAPPIGYPPSKMIIPSEQLTSTIPTPHGPSHPLHKHASTPNPLLERPLPTAPTKARSSMPSLPSHRLPFTSPTPNLTRISSSRSTTTTASRSTTESQSPIPYASFSMQTVARLSRNDIRDSVAFSGTRRVERRSHVASQHPSWWGGSQGDVF